MQYWHWWLSAVLCTLIEGLPPSVLRASRRAHRLWQGPQQQLVEEAPYFSALDDAAQEIKERFFFPGHSGGNNAPECMISRYGRGIFDLDLPELDGLDNIHCPEGPLLNALKYASNLYGAYRTWYLVNGSTSGILAAVIACVRMHEQREQQAQSSSSSVLIMGRDSHKSAFDALSLAGCDAALLPCVSDKDFGITVGVDIESIRIALDEYGPRVCAVLLTRPSYQGILCSDERLREIASLCHSRKVPLVVDEAHGSHLRFLDKTKYPQIRDALHCGADIVVQSAHKTLTALSQAAIMHMGNTAFSFSDDVSEVKTEAAAEVLHECFSMLTTTSPNALLLASLDATRAQMAQSGLSIVGRTAAAVDNLRNQCRQAGSGVQLLDDSAALHRRGAAASGRVWFVDPLRLTVRFPGRSALRVDDLMCEERGIFCELNLSGCITYGIPPGTDDQSLSVLSEALLEQARADGQSASASADSSSSEEFRVSDIGYANVRALRGAAVEVVPLDSSVRDELADGNRRTESPLESVSAPAPAPAPSSAVGRISAETICVYPPGIPLIAKGEGISEKVVKSLVSLRNAMKSAGSKVGDQTGSDAERESDPENESELGSGCTVTGCSDPSLNSIKVIKER